ncbi:MAG: hypothetical protein ACTSV7_14045 [Candidatus Baldrarchaeia archaeon]
MVTSIPIEKAVKERLRRAKAMLKATSWEDFFVKVCDLVEREVGKEKAEDAKQETTKQEIAQGELRAEAF